MALYVVEGDITQIACDAIVNAAKPSLLGGGGVDGAIHKAAGKGLLNECKTLGGCEVGQAKITNAYNLPCRYVIHTVGPKWQGGGAGEPELLVSCYWESLMLAYQYGCSTVAFPLISAGIYGYPKDQAMQIAQQTIEHFLSGGIDMTVYLVLYPQEQAAGNKRKTVMIAAAAAAAFIVVAGALLLLGGGKQNDALPPPADPTQLSSDFEADTEPTDAGAAREGDAEDQVLITHTLSTLPGTLGVGEDYYVYSTESGYTEEMCLAQGIEKVTVDNYLPICGYDMIILPKDTTFEDPSFCIYVRVKSDSDLGVDNLKALDESTFQFVADALVSGFSAMGEPIAHTVYENENGKYIVFDAVLYKNARRYATIINGKMVYFIAEAAGADISEEQDRQIRLLIDALQY